MLTALVCVAAIAGCGTDGGTAVDADGRADGNVDDAGVHPDGSDPCQGITCSGHGTCVITGGVAQCDCETGYQPVGLTCVEQTETGIAQQYPGDVGIENDPDVVFVEKFEQGSPI